MGALMWTAAVAAAVSFGADGRPDPIRRWDRFILEAAARTRIPAPWLRRVMRAESAGRAMLGGQPITSRAGAMGLMQLMPATWAGMRARLRLGNDPYDPHDNILAGAAFLRILYDRFGYPGLFGAYNAGPRRYRAYLSGAALPHETRAYLAKLTAGDAPSNQDFAAPGPGLFVILRSSIGPQSRPGRHDPLFALRPAVPDGVEPQLDLAETAG